MCSTHIAIILLRLYHACLCICSLVDSDAICLHVVQGLLSFLSAPLIGALSDIWGRKPFLLLTVTFTCAPIPLMKYSPWSDSAQLHVD